MTWTLEGKQGHEAAKVMWDLVPYTRGLGLDLGCGANKAFNHFIGVDNLKDTKLFGTPMQPDVVVQSCEKLGLFASGSLDFVFSSHLLEHIDDYKSTLSEWWRLIKPGGHLCLYLPHKDLYPRIGTQAEKDEWAEFAKSYVQEDGKVPGRALHELAAKRKAAGKLTTGDQYAGTPGGNHDHKHDFAPEDIVTAMQEFGGWDLAEREVRGEENEYSFFLVFRKLEGLEQTYSCDKPKPEKTCAVVRYGAFGDLIQTSSVFPGLKAQGYHLTLYTVPRGWEAIKHDPHVDRVIFQDTDQVPMGALGEFWAHLQKRYDKFVNLSESVEGTLLAMGNRIQGTWPTKLRHKMLNRNYLEFAADIAEVPFKPHTKFYSTPVERAWARAEREKLGSYVVLWSLAGSSVHKAWPHLDTVVARIMLEWRDAYVIMVGDNKAQMLERGWENEPRVLCRSGVWTIRESMSMIDEVDMVVGPETGVLNAAGFSSTPKICILSHSSADNLTRDWINCTALTPVDTPCYPCHMMHYDFTHCKPGYLEIEGQRQRVGSLCAVNIHPDRVWDALKQWRKKTMRKAA
jgi:ADP-heptose:LPS heptosyltransferase/SAM-dependent methyltransferase